MQFTPQQLVGAGRYAPTTRIGNWNEDLVLEEARMKEFQLRKKQGSLLATHKLKHDFLHQNAPRSFDKGQNVRFNHAVAIGHLESDGLLVCNVFEETPSIGSGEFLITVSTAAMGTVSRNTFRIISPSAWKEAQSSGRGFSFNSCSETLRYGEPFLIMCNEGLLVDDQSVLMKSPLFVKTGLKSERSMSPITYNQRVWLSAEADSAALWTCQRADLAGSEKFLAAGGDVKAGDHIEIVHKMTGQPLYASAKNKQPTDFSVELEVCGYGAKTTGKHHNLYAEATGLRTADTEGRISLPPNTWTFVLAASAQEAQDERQLPEMATPATVVNVIQRILMSESLYTFRRFLRGLMKVDTRGSGHLQHEEVKWFIKPLQLPLREQHLDILLSSLDRRNTGYFPLADLLQALRKPVSEARKREMNAAFDRLSGDGKLTLSSLIERYDPSVDSRVRCEQMSQEAAISEYQELWQVPQLTSEITRREFIEVYSDISMVLDNDAHFSQVISESWR